MVIRNSDRCLLALEVDLQNLRGGRMGKGRGHNLASTRLKSGAGRHGNDVRHSLRTHFWKIEIKSLACCDSFLFQPIGRPQHFDFQFATIRLGHRQLQAPQIGGIGIVPQQTFEIADLRILCQDTITHANVLDVTRGDPKRA